MFGKKGNIDSRDFSELTAVQLIYLIFDICRGIEENVKCEYFRHIRPLTVQERAQK